ncbi:hypothetical protein BDV93DRAFT_585536, partial [Ceratobasidium sp. AG-I]
MGPLPKAFGDGGWTPIKPLVELEMTTLSAALRSKPGWWIKFRDGKTLAKWRAEALAQAKKMKESHVDYVLQELDGYANLRDEQTGAEVSCYDRVWQSDKLVPPSLRERLIAGVFKLENVPASEKDWHPRSNGQVLDLVHPSLYPIVYGRTLAYPSDSNNRDPSMLKVVPIPTLPPTNPRPWPSYNTQDDNYHISLRFQWLPTDFQVSQDGGSAKSLGYINNLHPDEHAELHKTIEELIGAYIPLFERALTDSVYLNQIIPGRVSKKVVVEYPNSPQPSFGNFEDRGKFDRACDEWEKRRIIHAPDIVHDYVPGSLEERKTWYSLAGKKIQVIVKLANIYLTPENPEYTGGSWHIEGMSNESIVVSGIYYYDQHQVSPFKLVDKSKPGHRKILALFLIDPALNKPSTTTVPPQQQDWRFKATTANPVLQKRFSPEIINMIGSLGDGMLTRKEAEEYRLELMEERTAFVEENTDRHFFAGFNMCEH